MIMTTTFSHRLSPRILGCAVALILMGCGQPLHAQTVAIMVNGEPITYYGIEQRSKLNLLTTHKPPDHQQPVKELIDEKLKIKQARNYAVEPTSGDLDPPYAPRS